LQIGETLTIGHCAGYVRSIELRLHQHEQQLVVQLRDGGD